MQSALAKRKMIARVKPGGINWPFRVAATSLYSAFPRSFDRDDVLSDRPIVHGVTDWAGFQSK